MKKKNILIHKVKREKTVNVYSEEHINYEDVSYKNEIYLVLNENNGECYDDCSLYCWLYC